MIFRGGYVAREEFAPRLRFLGMLHAIAYT